MYRLLGWLSSLASYLVLKSSSTPSLRGSPLSQITDDDEETDWKVYTLHVVLVTLGCIYVIPFLGSYYTRHNICEILVTPCHIVCDQFIFIYQIVRYIFEALFDFSSSERNWLRLELEMELTHRMQNYTLPHTQIPLPQHRRGPESYDRGAESFSTFHRNNDKLGSLYYHRVQMLVQKIRGHILQTIDLGYLDSLQPRLSGYNPVVGNTILGLGLGSLQTAQTMPQQAGRPLTKCQEVRYRLLLEGLGYTEALQQRVQAERNRRPFYGYIARRTWNEKIFSLRYALSFFDDLFSYEDVSQKGFRHGWNLLDGSPLQGYVFSILTDSKSRLQSFRASPRLYNPRFFDSAYSVYRKWVQEARTLTGTQNHRTKYAYFKLLLTRNLYDMLFLLIGPYFAFRIHIISTVYASRAMTTLINIWSNEQELLVRQRHTRTIMNGSRPHLRPYLRPRGVSLEDQQALEVLRNAMLLVMPFGSTGRMQQLGGTWGRNSHVLTGTNLFGLTHHVHVPRMELYREHNDHRRERSQLEVLLARQQNPYDRRLDVDTDSSESSDAPRSPTGTQAEPHGEHHIEEDLLVAQLGGGVAEGADVALAIVDELPRQQVVEGTETP